jgi:hypothetical protein
VTPRRGEGGGVADGYGTRVSLLLIPAILVGAMVLPLAMALLEPKHDAAHRGPSRRRRTG